MNKHYDSSYLSQSALTIKEAKEYSYKSIINLKQGSVLDLGCGNGLDLLHLNKISSNKVKLIGVDHDSTLIKEAIKHAQSTNVNFICADASQLPFDENTFDVIRTERMFQHLSNSSVVLKEIKRLLNKTGVLEILETDWEGINFYTEHIEIEQKIRRYLVDTKINFGLASRKLPFMLLEKKFIIKEFKSFQLKTNSIDGLNILIQFEKILEEMKVREALTESEIQLFVNTLKQREKSVSLLCSTDILFISCHH